MQHTKVDMPLNKETKPYTRFKFISFRSELPTYKSTHKKSPDTLQIDIS